MRKVCADFIWKAFWKCSQPNKILFLLKNDPSPDNPTRGPISQIDDEAGLEIMMIMIQHYCTILMTMVKMMLLNQRGRRERGEYFVICMMTTQLQERSLVSWTMSKLCRQTKFSDVFMAYVVCTALGHKIARYLWRTGICCIDCDIMDCDVAMTMLSINVNNQDKSDDEGTWAVLRVVHCQHFVPKYWILGSWYEVADCVSRYCQR